MHGLSPTDPGITLDWGNASHDYARYRSGPPQRYYDCLQALGVGIRGQMILDLGTGTGVLARHFAKSGAIVFGLDPSREQVRAAVGLVTPETHASFIVARSESIPFANATFDALTANQCWLYFDRNRAVAEAKRVLKPGGVLMTSYFSWLPREDPVAHLTEQLVLKYNPAWSAADFEGDTPTRPPWVKDDFKVRSMFVFNERVPFTRDTWRGRIRACRGIGASLSQDEVERFDREFARALETEVPESFSVLHRIDAHLLEPV